MQFRAIISTSILAACTALLSVGCTLDTKPNSLKDNATFRVDRIEGNVENYSVYQSWNLPSERLFNFTACIQDISQRSTIVNHRFEVSGGDRKYVAKSDSEGCIHWPEVIGFDVFAQPTFIRVQRTIKSLGKQRGEVAYEFAINPWSKIVGSEAAVADLKRTTVSKISSLADAHKLLRAKSSTPVRLELNTVNLDVQMSSPKAGQDAILRVNANPSIILQDMNNNVVRLPLERGAFFVKAKILRVDNPSTGDKTLIHKDFEPQKVKVVNGSLVFQTPLKFTAAIDPQKTYELLFELIPDKAPSYLADFAGVYQISEVERLQGSTLSLTSEFKSQIASFSPKTYLAKVRGLTGPPGKVDLPNVFTFETVTAMQNGVASEDTMDRFVRLSLSVNVKWTLTKAPVVDRKFNIYSVRRDNQPLHLVGSNMPKATNSSGYLEWDDVVSHRIYKKAQRYRYEIVFEDVLTHQQYTKCALVNPWDFWSTFFRDCEQMNDIVIPESQRLALPVPKVPTLKVNGLCMARTDSATDNLITPDLSLEVRHRFNLAIDASVLRFDDLRTGLQTPPDAMRGGWWLMTVVAFRNDIPNNRVGDRDAKGNLLPVITFEKAICNPSSPASEIELKLRELGLMDKRNYFAIQFKPLDQKKLKFAYGVDVNSGPNCIGSEVTADSPIVIDRDNDLLSPPYIFPVTPRNDSCPIVIPANNFVDPRLKVLQSELNSIELHNMHVAFQAQKAKELEEEKRLRTADKAEGWKKVGQRSDLIPILIDDPKGLLGYASPQLPLTAVKMSSALTCLDQNFWADRNQRAQCANQPDMMSTVEGLCVAIHAALGVTGKGCATPFEAISAEEKIHVYNFTNSEYVSGFSTSFTASNSFAVGSFEGSDFGGMKSDTIAGSAGADAGVGVGKVGLSAGMSLSKAWTGVNVNFTREWSDNQLNVSAGASFIVENMDLNLYINEYRRCYIVRTVQVPLKGLYVCGPIETDPIVRQERYFLMFNPGSNGGMLNSADDRNRWILQFRGERIFYYLSTKFSENFGQYNISGVPVPITDVLKRVYPLMSEYRRSWGDPYVLSSIAPGAEGFEPIPGTERDLPILGFNPVGFNNRVYRNQNDPNIRRRDGQNQFGR